MAKPSPVETKVKKFFAGQPSKRYPKGQIIILAEQQPEHVIYLVEGHIKQYDITDKGEEVVVNVFKPPAFFPMSWAINKTPNNYFFETASAVRAKIAPADKVVEFLKENPDVMFDLLSRLYRGMDGVLRRMAHLMGGSATSRLEYELLVETLRFGSRRKDNSYLLDISENELGARAGLSRETVSREISQLKKLDLISISRKGIVIKNIKALQDRLGSNL